MKLFVAAIFAFLAVSTFAEDIDWSTVVPRTEVPGFWDGRDIKPAFNTSTNVRTGRIVGGAVVRPNAHPYKAGLLVNVATQVFAVDQC
jgi:hypothetical protein